MNIYLAILLKDIITQCVKAEFPVPASSQKLAKKLKGETKKAHNPWELIMKPTESDNLSVVPCGTVYKHKYSRWTHSLSIMPTGTQGSNKGPPQVSVSGQLLDGAPVVVQVPHLFLDSASPCIFGSTQPAPTLWCPVECHLRNRVSLPPNDITYPSPSSLHDDGTNALLFELYKQILVGNGLRSENTKDFSQTFRVEGRQLSQITFCHSPAFWPIQKGKQNTATVDLELGAPHIVQHLERVPGFV